MRMITHTALFSVLLLSTTWTTPVAALVPLLPPTLRNGRPTTAFGSSSSSSAMGGVFLATRRSWLGNPVAAAAAAAASTNFFDLPMANNDTLSTFKQEQQSLRRVLQLEDADSTPSSSSSSSFPAVVGHRGCLYDALENTREGFQKCMAMGCDAVELDVFALKCGTLVVFHGGGTDENPGLLDGYVVGNFRRGSGIMEYTYREILQHDWTFNVDHEEFPCPRDSILRGSIPTLEQVLQDVKESSSNMHITMELKGGHQLPERVLQLVDDLDMAHQTSCSSFNMEFLDKVRSLRPHRDDNGKYLYKTGALFNDVYDRDGLLAKAHAVGANEIHLRYDTCTKGLIDDIHRQGFGSMAWFRGPVGMGYDSNFKYRDVGNEDESMYHVVSQTGVQRMCVNKPDVLLGMKEKALASSGVRTTTSIAA